MKKTILYSIISIICINLVSCKFLNKNSNLDTEQSVLCQCDSLMTSYMTDTTNVDLKNLPEEPIFDIITNVGTIKVKLFKNTPKHRDNFAKLALSGFYNGILFHRVINGFMIQAGDPLTKDKSNESKFGTGGPGYTIPSEINSENKHIKGALAAARMGDIVNPKRESSGSQFYIVQDAENCQHLDGQYTVFGETIEGLNIIDSIANVDVNRYDRPTKDIVIEKIILDKTNR